MTFVAAEQPADDQIAAVAALAPDNPFYTPAYVRARVEGGGGHLLLLTFQQEDGVLLAGCPAYLRQGRWLRTLEIESLPKLPAEGEAFWAGLKQLCRARRIGLLVANTYASEPVNIPSLGHRLERRERTEHVLGLTTYDETLGQASSQHRRNLKRARKAGLIARAARDDRALATHTELMQASMQRRRERGESVPEATQSDRRRFERLLASGAAELFQAERQGMVVSSLFVLLAERGAYYQSAGTSPDGMACGASPFLLHETACLLRRRGLERFNLGGAHTSEAGLYRFKSDFGGMQVALEAVRADFSNPLIRSARTLLRQLRT